MIDGVLNSILLFLANWRPSVLGYGYGIFGLILWLQCLRKSLVSSMIYKFILAYSVSVIFLKLIFLIVFWTNSTLSLFKHKTILNIFGIHVGWAVDTDMIMNFYAEVVGLALSVVGIIYRKRIRFNKHFFSSRFMGFMVLIGLIVTCLSYYSFLNAVYFTYLITWICFWGYRINERFLNLGIQIISGTTIIQILLSPLCKIFLPGSQGLKAKIGVLYFRDETLGTYLCAYYLFFASISYVRRLTLKEFKRESTDIDNLDANLIRRPSMVNPRFSALVDRMTEYLSFTLIYGICMFNIFLWIANFRGYVQIIMIIWMFYAIIEKKEYMDRLMLVVTRQFFIPLIITDCCILYLYSMINVELPVYISNYKKDYSQLYVLYEFWTISMFFVLQRRYKKKNIDNKNSSINMNIIIGIFLENSNKVALIVVFIIGLSRINLFHLGFMIIFLVFMLSSEISKKYWIILVLYTQVMIMIEYVFGIVIYSGVTVHQTPALTLIGLSSKEIDLIAVIFPQNFLTWILLLSAAMQLSAYRSSYIVRNRRETVQGAKGSLVIVFFSKLYAYIIFFHVWIVYIAIFFAIMMSSLNLINYGRLMLLVILYCLHIMNTTQTLAQNMPKVERRWNLLVYYSGAVLVVRYLYQFFRFAEEYVLTSKFIGIDIYSDAELYENMVTDCIILLVCVYQKTRMNTLRDIDNPSGNEYISITEMIRLRGLSRSTAHESVKTFGISYFCYVTFVVIFAMTVYYRISASMFLYVISIIIYSGAVETHIFRSIKNKEDHNHELVKNYRIRIWKVLMVLTIIYILVSCLSFCIRKNVFTRNYHNMEWAYFIMGFSIVGDHFPLVSNYQYMLICLLLTIERHFLDDLIQHGVGDLTPKTPKANLIIKILIESFLPSLTLAVSFSKLTVVSIYYSVIVLASILVRSYIRARILFYTILVASLVQYLSLLINLSKYDSPYPVPDHSKDPPWKAIYNDRENDTLTFFNVGTQMKQTLGLFGDLGVIWVLCIFFALFAMAEGDLQTVFKQRESGLTKKQRKYKEIVYSVMHFLVLFIVLVFISESSGFFSLFYCIFCLISIFLANRILRNLNSFNKYKKLLKYFLVPLMTGELFIQTLFQIPIHGHFNTYDEEWFNAIGLAQLWTAGGHEPKDIEQKYKRIYFKIFTLGFILLVSWMMNTEDYLKFVKNLSKKYRIKAKKLAIQLAYNFNNQRVKKIKERKQEQERAKKELELLEENVKRWNLKYYERSTINFKAGIGSEENIETVTSENLKSKYKPGVRRMLQNYLIHNINPIIFKHFLCRIKLKKNEMIKKEEQDEKERMQAGVLGEGTESISLSDDEEQRRRLITKLKKKQHVYILNYKDYMKLLLYAACSSTQAIVFFFFFMNHFYYASLESLIFPLSILCYALLAYPRPNPKYFKIMLIYTEIVFLIKFLLNLYIWDFLDRDYPDAAKIGFNFFQNTYSKSLTNYIVFDAVCMLTLLAHEYYLIRCGLHEHTEIEIENLHQAQTRRKFLSTRRSLRLSMAGKTEKRPKVNFGARLRGFFGGIHGGQNEDKPGFDYYTWTVITQFFILVFILFFFPQMSGESESVIGIFE